MSFLHFTSRERVGIIALFIISILFFFWLTIPKTETPKSIPSLGNKKYFKKQYPSYTYKKQNYAKHEFHFVDFDPNTTSLNEFMEMGLSEKQASVIIRYREKGGRFRTANDFAKIYSIRPEIHEQIKPYIHIDTSKFVWKSKKLRPFEKRQIIVDLNNATEEELTKLPLIACGRAHTIALFREKVGGFYSIQQLNEVYGLSPDIVDSIKGFLVVDTTKLKRININTAGIMDMKTHPYFKYFTAKKIVDYRNIKGVINTPSELLRNKIVDSLTYRKISHYIRTK